MTAPLHLAVALDGTGWHPTSWRSDTARPVELFTARYWTDLVLEAERGLIDLVTVEDSLALQSDTYGTPDDRTDRVRGRLDAVLIASRVAPVTRHVGLVPSVTVTHTEPFHASKAIATLDYVSSGRAGVRVQVSGRAHEAELFGRRSFPKLELADLTGAAGQALTTDLFAEAGDYVEVLRRLWDSWEDGAEIRDAATGRFIDRNKLHYIDFDGPWFSVKGPSITPRPPQGQPLVTLLAHTAEPARLGGAVADVVFVTPSDANDVAGFVDAVRTAQAAAGREGETVHIFADLAVLLETDDVRSTERLFRLDALAGSTYGGGDAHLFAGKAGDLADLLLDWQSRGITGFRLRPAELPYDLEQITRSLVPELQLRGAFRSSYDHDTLRARLGLPRPANRFAA